MYARKCLQSTIMEEKKTTNKPTQTFSGKSACQSASLKYLYSDVCSMENKHEKLDICVHLQVCDPVVIAEVWWNVLHDWSAAEERYRLLRKDRAGR